MRVCIVYDCLYPYTIGGAERWYRSLAERLAGSGVEVTYLTLRQWERGAEPDLPGVQVVAVGPRVALYTRGGRRRVLPPLLFGLGVLLHLIRHGRRYDDRPHRIVPVLLAPRSRRGPRSSQDSGSWSTGTRSGPGSTGANTSAHSPVESAGSCSAPVCAYPSVRSASRGCTSGAYANSVSAGS